MTFKLNVSRHLLVNITVRFSKAKGQWQVFDKSVCSGHLLLQHWSKSRHQISFVSKSHMWTSFRMKAHTVLRAARPQSHFWFHSKESHLHALLSLLRQLKQCRLPRCSWSSFTGPRSTSLSKHYPDIPAALPGFPFQEFPEVVRGQTAAGS